MSIVSEIERIKSNIANAYTACEEKGATMPSVLNSANLFECIASITGGGTTTKILNYYGTTANLASSSICLASTSIGDYALFGGGTGSNVTSGSGLTTVTSYDKDLVKGTATNLSVGRRRLGATSNENYAIFAGGSKTGDVSTSVNNVDAYDKNLVKATVAALPKEKQFYHNNVTSVGEYALFGVGSISNGKVLTVDAYNSNLVLTTVSAEMSVTCGATSIGDYALFAGSVDGTEVYDKNLVRRLISGISSTRGEISGVNNKKYAIFAGGSLVKNVDAYDKNLVKTTATELSVARCASGATTLGDYAIIAGGGTSSSSASDCDVVEAFNSDLAKFNLHALSSTRKYLGGATVGDYALFGGGQSGSTSSAKNTVDVFELVG